MTPEQIRERLRGEPSPSDLARAEAEDEAALNRRIEDLEEPHSGLPLMLLLGFTLIVGIAIGFLAGLHHGPH